MKLKDIRKQAATGNVKITRFKPEFNGPNRAARRNGYTILKAEDQNDDYPKNRH